MLQSLRFLASLDLPSARPLEEYLQKLTVTPLMLQDYSPVAQNSNGNYRNFLGPARAYCNSLLAGSFVINNNGRLSEAAARVLFPSLLDVPPDFSLKSLNWVRAVVCSPDISSRASPISATQRSATGSTDLCIL